MNKIAIIFLWGLAITSVGCRTASDASSNNASQTVAAGDAATSPTQNATPTPSGDVAALLGEGKKHFEDYRNDEAIASFKRVLEIDPENAEACYRLGLVYKDAGDDEEAEKALTQAVERFEKVVRENEDDVAAQRYLALANSRLGNHHEAIKAYRQVVRLAPDESYNHYELGLELMRTAHYPEAVQALKKATQLDPDNFRAVEALDRAQEGVKRRELALKKQEEELRQQEAGGRPGAKRPNTVPTLPTLTAPPKPTPQANQSPRPSGD